MTQFTPAPPTKPQSRAAVLQFTARNAQPVQDASIMKLIDLVLGLLGAHKPDMALKKRAELIETCGNTGKKLTLADECCAHRMHGEAIRLYESCLQGAHAADSTILFRLARAAVDAALWDKAMAAIERLKSEAPKTRPLEVRLLEARVLEGRQCTRQAIAAYEQLLPRFVGLEAKYRYGELLVKVGRREAAMDIFDDVLRTAQRFASPIEEEERWADAAKQAARAAA